MTRKVQGFGADWDRGRGGCERPPSGLCGSARRGAPRACSGLQRLDPGLQGLILFAREPRHFEPLRRLSNVSLHPPCDRAAVVDLLKAPAGSAWHVVPRPGGWVVMLRLPEPDAAGKAEVSLAVWGLPRDDEELIKGLKAK